MTISDVPAEVAYGQIVGRLVEFLADSSDDATVPDERPLSGVVRLTPSVSLMRWPSTTPPRSAVMQTITCKVVNGDLLAPDGVSVVWVAASEQPFGEPDHVQWTASFGLTGVTAQPPSVTFDVPANGVVDLSTVIPSPPVPGTVTVVSSADRIAAEAARDAAEAALAGVGPAVTAEITDPASDARAVLNATFALIVEGVNTVATSGAAQTIPDVTASTISRITLTANCTLTFPAASAGKSFTLVLVQDGTGSRLITWPASIVKWAGGTAPTLSTGINKIDYLTFVCTDGTNWAGFLSGKDVR